MGDHGLVVPKPLEKIVRQFVQRQLMSMCQFLAVTFHLEGRKQFWPQTIFTGRVVGREGFPSRDFRKGMSAAKPCSGIHFHSVALMRH